MKNAKQQRTSVGLIAEQNLWEMSNWNVARLAQLGIDFKKKSSLRDRNAFCQVSGLVYVAASAYGYMVGEEL